MVVDFFNYWIDCFGSSTCVQGMAAFIAAMIVFVGSVTLLLSMVLGGRLAYFVSATVTLAFILIMSAVWAQPTKGDLPLGPVGEAPSWSVEGVGESPEDVDFGPAGDFPDEGGWRAPDEESKDDTSKAASLETAATDALEAAIEEDEEVGGFADVDQAAPADEGTLLLEQGGETYGGVLFEPVEDEGDQAVVFMKYDPGNPSGPARMIFVGTLVLFVLHLFGLSRSERRARRDTEATNNSR